MSFPEGHYTGVRAVQVQSGSTLLSNGTGTMASSGLFSCGMFKSPDYPEIEKICKVSGTTGGNYYEDPMRCVATGDQTCDFKES